ncbi:MAG: PAS/PAC sensor hybrid histidine kinase [Parcubacteria group bacterium GW2011_GWF2_38_76]|nr:MAG: PAS/PAC sensor hybrid histidine kinase [Parcubacteria group bacterium GW2011_GWF2_38_76]HBM45367.1 hypothetical protein [Patescibacteria group bacterium]
MKNKILYLFSVLLMLVSFNSSFSAERRLIKVGAFNNFPVIFKDTDGVFKGLYVELLTEIGLKENINFEYILGTWNEGLDRIKTGEVDLLTSVGYTEERSLFMDYTQNPLLTVWGEVYAPKNSEIKGILEISNKKIGILSGDINAINFKNRLLSFNIDCLFVEFSSYDDVFKAISENKVDAGVAGITFGEANEEKYGLKSTGIVFNPLNLYFTTAKNKNQDILTVLDKYLLEWRNQEDSFLSRAKQKWLYGSVGAIVVIPLWVKEFLAILGIGFLVAMVFIILLKSQIKKATDKILQRESALKESEEKYRILFHSAGDIIIVHSEDGKILASNHLACERLGYAHEEMLKINVTDLDSKEEAARIPERIKNVMSSGKLAFETNLKQKDGAVIPVEVSARLIMWEGKPAIMSIGRDVAERKKMEETLRQKLEEVEKLNKFMVGREVKMVEIKEENERLREKLKDCK